MKKKPGSNKFFLLWYAHPRAAIGLMLALINLFIIFLFTGILSLVSGNAFSDELAYLFTYTMSADGIYDFVNHQEDLACFVIKIVLTVIQMIIFSGALIGFTTNILQTTIDRRLSNTGKLRLKNHFVFLNWSSIGPNLIYDLSFLEGQKTVVVLCEKEPDAVLSSIQNIFSQNSKRMKGIKLFVKNGEPDSVKDLQDVSIERAAHVGIFLSNVEDNGQHAISNKDLTSFKLLMSVLHTGTKANVVVEVEKRATALRVQQFIHETNPAFEERVSIFSHNLVLGHILGHAVINPAYSYIYHELLSYEGCEFYGVPPMSIDDALCHFSDCIPVANYDDNGNAVADQLYVLSDKDNHFGERKQPRSFVRPLTYREREQREDFTLIIISDSLKQLFVLEEIKNYNRVYGRSIKYQTFSFRDDVTTVIDGINAIEGRKKVLLLSNDGESDSDQDADIFISLLAFRTSGKIGDEVEIYTEIANPRNLLPMKNLGVVSVIVSNKIISLFMIQLLTHPESERFYRDLIVADTAEGEDNIIIEVVRAGDLLEFANGPLHFSCYSELVHSFYAASGRVRMCLGVHFAGTDPSELLFLCDAMDKERELVIAPDDELILTMFRKGKREGGV